MRKIKSCFFILLALAIILPLAPPAYIGADSELVPPNSSYAADGFKAVWVATVLNLDYPSKPGLTPDMLKSEALTVLDNAKAMGFNAVIFQVRPSGDALYKSQIFPWSNYLTGSQGVAPADGFDPLEFWITEAHARDMELHAWINPFRITRGSEQKPLHNIEGLATINPAKQHPDWVIKHPDGNLYFDPGIPAARELIVAGVSEIVNGYDVDGIQFDDYFYPGKDFDDSASYGKYGAGANKDDWRRGNINAFIKDTYSAVKSANPDAVFGVSPFGIWANKSSNPEGSATSGNESYYTMYADSRLWVKENWVDYICPQIYWSIGYDAADYGVILSWWADQVRGTSVKLYAGQGAYRAGSSTDPSNPWCGSDEILRQISLNRRTPEVGGSIYFRYGTINANPDLTYMLKQAYVYGGGAQPGSLPPDAGSLFIGRPSSNTNTSYSTYYILGASDPSKPLYMNGKEITTRTAGGFFGVYVGLQKGANTFTFTQDGKTVNRVITRGSGSSQTASASSAGRSAATMAASSSSAPGIAAGLPDVYDEYRAPGEKITLSCKAAIGSEVTVTVGGKSFAMKPASTVKPAKGYATTTFSYVYTIPETDVTGKLINLGAPVYTMKYGKTVKSVTATADVQCITPGAPYFAEVQSATAFTYPGNTTTGGPTGELVRGQRDYITAVTNGGTWVRLSSKQWVLRSDVKRELLETPLNPVISAAYYAPPDEKRWETLRLDISGLAATQTSFDGSALVFSVYNVASAPVPELPENPTFESITALLDGDRAVYTLKLLPGVRINGYYTEAEPGILKLKVRRVPKVPIDMPLSGLHFVVDPGHGDDDPGAIGPLGIGLAEKDIALASSIKLKAELENLGATVTMTRTRDVRVTLEERLAISRQIKPDLFISIHNNAVETNVDASNIYGLGIWYKETFSEDFANRLYYSLISELGRFKRGTNQTNLYVCRGTWTPSAIIETGFICCPSEYEWLVDDQSQTRLAQAIANSVVKYFS